MGVGHGRLIKQRGRVAGHRGNMHRPAAAVVGPAQVAAAAAAAALQGAGATTTAAVQVPAATGGSRGAGQTHRHNNSARGTQRAKTLPNLPVVGKRKFDGGHQNQGDPKRRYGSGVIGNGGAGAGGLGGSLSNWGTQPLPQQPLGSSNGEPWYTDTYSPWS